MRPVASVADPFAAVGLRLAFALVSGEVGGKRRGISAQVADDPHWSVAGHGAGRRLRGRSGRRGRAGAEGGGRVSLSWNGAGLPPVAAARVARGGSGGPWSSALSAGEFAAIRSVGFEPVGQVMGSTVVHVDRAGPYPGYLACGYTNQGFGLSVVPVALSGDGAPCAALVQAYDSARRTALARMNAECVALGGDGVVAAQLTMAPFPAAANCQEFQVIGTAVRAAGPVRPPRPFTTHLDGLGFAKLLDAGWVPVDLLVATSIGVRHDESATREAADSWANQQMDGWTRLVKLVRADARRQLRRHGARHGGDGIILSSADLRVWEESCVSKTGGDGKRDHLAESTLVGTTIARFTTAPAQPRTLTVMLLNDDGALRRRLAQAADH